jgi:hypothetical protein
MCGVWCVVCGACVCSDLLVLDLLDPHVLLRHGTQLGCLALLPLVLEGPVRGALLLLTEVLHLLQQACNNGVRIVSERCKNGVIV